MVSCRIPSRSNLKCARSRRPWMAVQSPHGGGRPDLASAATTNARAAFLFFLGALPSRFWTPREFIVCKAGAFIDPFAGQLGRRNRADGLPAVRPARTDAAIKSPVEAGLAWALPKLMMPTNVPTSRWVPQ